MVSPVFFRRTAYLIGMLAMIKVQLIVVQGKPEGKTIPLVGPLFVIGRDEGCHLRPSSDEVSRRHSEIAIGAETATLRDLGSRNGTFLNGRAVAEPAVLKSGDLIKVGPLTFAVSIQGPATAAPAPKPGSGVKSLDEVGHEEVASWLIGDEKHPVPERPSGVYDGETTTIAAYKDKEGAAKQTAESATKPVPAPPPPAPAAAAKPAPAPAPPVAETKPAPPPAPAAPVPPPKPVAEAKPAPAPAKPAASTTPVPTAGTVRKSIWDEIEFIEALPEGQGDAEPEPAADEAEEGASGGTESDRAAAGTPEEWVDESNPFYAAKKKTAPQAGPAPAPEAAKPSFKDSSEAANAILKKMLERKKGGG